MNIETRYFGNMEISEEEIVNFKQGLPGFNNEKEFVVLPFAEEDTPFHILQSINTTSLAFVVANPFVFFPDYEFDLSKDLTEQLQIEEEEDVAVFVILTIQDPFENTTANLKAPVIMNLKEKFGKQYVLNVDHYNTKHVISKEAVTKEGR